MTTAPIAAAVAAPAPPPPVVLQTIVDVPLPGSASRFDYQSLDEASGRLVIAHMGADQVVIVDTATRQVVGSVGDVKTPTGVLAVPELGRIFAAGAGSGDVAVIDAER
jgi:DNA-binding beta-propeller fold protein YncE